MAQPNNDTSGFWGPKKASETRVLYLDFSRQPEIVDGQTMSSPAVTANLMDGGQPTGTSDLTLGSPTVTGNKVKFSVAGGTDGNHYRITCTVNLSDGVSNLKEFGDLRVRN